MTIVLTCTRNIAYKMKRKRLINDLRNDLACTLLDLHIYNKEIKLKQVA